NSNEFDKEIDENGDIREALGNNDTKGESDAPKDGIGLGGIPVNTNTENKDENKDEDKDLTPEEKEKLAIATNDSNKAI
ncbi:hypothetical protein GUH44_12870, partial [Xanthomonas citri pv. citri]|nr:hypothetical protein [Xanthomonas citri pv. citri]